MICWPHWIHWNHLGLRVGGKFWTAGSHRWFKAPWFKASNLEQNIMWGRLNGSKPTMVGRSSSASPEYPDFIRFPYPFLGQGSMMFAERVKEVRWIGNDSCIVSKDKPETQVGGKNMDSNIDIPLRKPINWFFRYPMTCSRVWGSIFWAITRWLCEIWVLLFLFMAIKEEREVCFCQTWNLMGTQLLETHIKPGNIFERSPNIFRKILARRRGRIPMAWASKWGAINGTGGILAMDQSAAGSSILIK